MAYRYRFKPGAAGSAGITPQAMRDCQWAFERMAARSIAAARQRATEERNKK